MQIVCDGPPPTAHAAAIQQVNAPVAQLAVAVEPLPMPIVVQVLALEGHDRGGPQVVVDRRGDRLRPLTRRCWNAGRIRGSVTAQVALSDELQRFVAAVLPRATVGALHNAMYLRAAATICRPSKMLYEAASAYTSLPAWQARW